MLAKPLFLYPPVYLALFLLAQWGLDTHYPVLNFAPTVWLFWLGAGLIAASVLVVLLINFQFKKAETSIIPYKESDALLTSGFFAYSRNPIYLMMATVLLGAALMFSSLAPFLPVFVFPILIQWRFIKAEEAMVEEAFGEEYREYKASVRRWI